MQWFFVLGIILASNFKHLIRIFDSDQMIVALAPILFALVVLANIAVTLWVEFAEGRRRRRYRLRIRQVFRPRVIEGGKAQAPPAEEDGPRETKIA